VPSSKPTSKTKSQSKTPKKSASTKTTAKKSVAKKATSSGATGAKRAAGKGGTGRRTPAKARPVRDTSTGAMRARRGDLIVIDSAQVGSPSREGEVLQVIQGQVSVSYRVRWADGHETLISPAAGTTTIVRT
jgi:hypothetical protein